MQGDDFRIGSHIRIPLREIEITFARSSGPGGQNVNKVASKAVLRFNLRHSPSLPAPLRERALAKLASRLTRDGALVLSGRRYRDAARNRADVIERLRVLLSDATRVPRRRRSTRPSAAARERRLEAKKMRGALKRARAKVREPVTW